MAGQVGRRGLSAARKVRQTWRGPGEGMQRSGVGKSVEHEERRELLAAAALRVIMRDGIAGLTVREVAKEAGFTTGALTHYFHSKDHLLIEASEHSARLGRDRMERAARTRPGLGGAPQ